MESGALKKLALTVEYDGTRYHGSQFQNGVPTVQGEIERALTKLTGERIRIVSAGRTDAGVHARGQVVSFGTSSDLPPWTFARALNYYLAEDIAIRATIRVEESFNARKDAISREYQYRILNSEVRSPLQGKYAYCVSGKIDIDAINEACYCLVGKHDFASFTGPCENDTVREIYGAEISREDDIIKLDIKAKSFLYKQVRYIAGALVRVGLGKMDAEDFRHVMEEKRPCGAGPLAPAHGLCLMKVNYDKNIFSKGS